ncbi:MAG: dynamin family protein [Gemmatimonadales bacterium]
MTPYRQPAVGGHFMEAGNPITIEPPFEPASRGDAGATDSLAAVAREVGQPDLVAEALALAERAQAGGFYLACVGQFKRGKSTLINALLGAPVLPTGVVPVTSLPVLVRYGERSARLRRIGRTDWEVIPVEDIPLYVTETDNPGNARQIAAVELRLPSPLLREGVCLMDTPGLGSVFTWNTDRTHESAPQIDALLIVTGVEPPITRDELALLEQVSDPAIPRLLVLNKADRATAEELEQADRFTRRILRERLGWSIPRTYLVSATEALAGRGGGDWSALVDTVRRLAGSVGERLARAAVERGRERLVRRLREALRAGRDALVQPIERTEARMAALRDQAGGVRRALQEMPPLLRMIERQLAEQMAGRRAAFLSAAGPQARAEQARALREAPGGLRRRGALELSEQIARRHVLPWLEGIEPEAESAYDRAMGRLTGEVGSLLDRLGATDPVLSDVVPEWTGGRQAFRTGRRFYFLDYHDLVAPAGLDWLAGAMLDRLLPRSVARRRIEAAAHGMLERLLEVNTTRVQNDLTERVRESGRRLQHDIRLALAAALGAAEESYARARALRDAGADAVSVELARLDGLLGRLEAPA